MKLLVVLFLLVISQNAVAGEWKCTINGEEIMLRLNDDYKSTIELVPRSQGDILLTVNTPSLWNMYWVPRNQLVEVLQQLQSRYPTIPEGLIERIRNHFNPTSINSAVTQTEPFPAVNSLDGQLTAFEQTEFVRLQQLLQRWRSLDSDYHSSMYADCPGGEPGIEILGEQNSVENLIEQLLRTLLMNGQLHPLDQNEFNEIFRQTHYPRIFALVNRPNGRRFPQMLARGIRSSNSTTAQAAETPVGVKTVFSSFTGASRR